MIKPFWRDLFTKRQVLFGLQKSHLSLTNRYLKGFSQIVILWDFHKSLSYGTFRIFHCFRSLSIREPHVQLFINRLGILKICRYERFLKVKVIIHGWSLVFVESSSVNLYDHQHKIYLIIDSALRYQNDMNL